MLQYNDGYDDRQCPYVTDVGARAKSLCDLSNIMRDGTSLHIRAHPSFLGRFLELNFDVDRRFSMNRSVTKKNDDSRNRWNIHVAPCMIINNFKVGADSRARGSWKALLSNVNVAVASSGLFPCITTGIKWGSDMSVNYAAAFQSRLLSASVRVDECLDCVKSVLSSSVQLSHRVNADNTLSCVVGCESSWRLNDRSVSPSDFVIASSLRTIHRERGNTGEITFEVRPRTGEIRGTLLKSFGRSGLTVALHGQRGFMSSSERKRQNNLKGEIAVEQRLDSSSALRAVFTHDCNMVLSYIQRVSDYMKMILSWQIGDRNTTSVTLELND